jgi:hypothetical protein
VQVGCLAAGRRTWRLAEGTGRDGEPVSEKMRNLFLNRNEPLTGEKDRFAPHRLISSARAPAAATGTAAPAETRSSSFGNRPSARGFLPRALPPALPGARPRQARCRRCTPCSPPSSGPESPGTRRIHPFCLLFQFATLSETLFMRICHVTCCSCFAHTSCST